MDDEYIRYDKLESALQDQSSEPCGVPLEYLRRITSNFSNNLLLGEGGFGKVYKGVLSNEKMVAVKKLEQLKPGVVDRQFGNEVYHLMKLKHPNIVRFLGYCNETRNECLEYNGKYIFAEVQERLLCFEYLPNGSLDGHLSDESSGLDWHTRYRIIKGICCGLHYLQEECKCQINDSIIHLDLKPGNILLDENMEPKVADFGLSRLFEDERTHDQTSTLVGSPGYMAPEYIQHHITTKADIYSLGVIIIEIITGRLVDPFDSVTNRQDFIESVLRCWRTRLEASRTYIVETEYQQIQSCLEIGLSCIKLNHMERPTTGEIIEKISSWECTNCYVSEEQSVPEDMVSRRYDKLENMSQDGSSEPRNLPLEYLRNITKDFSDERLLGEGGFGTVYKGVLPNGEIIAVKKINSSIMPGVKDRHFENEAHHLTRLKHPNVVLLVGWCSETENIYVLYNGKYICAEKSERLLCLEYMPKGSLREYLSDEASGLDWDTRFKIIEGICYGLHYLHEESQHNAPIIHMDLKPANILLDNNMVPKIADFGLSRLFNGDKTWTCTTSRDGTLGYMAPEYINKGLISTKSDIFSLGVIIIEIVTGRRDYPDETEISSQEFIEPVLKNWRNRLQKALDYTTLEIYCQQIIRCIQIGLVCLKLDRSKRPRISQIIKTLHGSESADFSGRKEAYQDWASSSEEPHKYTSSLEKQYLDEKQHASARRSGHGVRHQDVVEKEDGSSTTTESMLYLPRRKKNRSWIRGELLGSGSFASVYEGISDEGLFIAVKEMNLFELGSNAKQCIFHLEQVIALLSQFEHENIVQYYGTDKEDSKLYIFLELVTQGSLASLYQKYRLQDSQVSAYTRQILIGLTYLHERNIVHRDIKCANIMVHANGSVKLADFGIAKEIAKFNNVLKSCEGTVYWMAPEVVNPKKTYGSAADIWSLGCTVLEMLTRQIPYPGLKWTQALYKIGRGEAPPIPNTLSKDARGFISLCVKPNAEDRPSASKLLEHPYVYRSIRHQLKGPSVDGDL